MNRTMKMLLAGAALVPGLALADNLSYTYVEAGYQQVDPDGADSADGWALRGSLALADMWHVFTDYNTVDFDGIDADFLRVGGGINYSVSPAVDLIGRLSWARVEVGSQSEDGYGVTALVRSQIAPNFELEGGVEFIDLGSDAGDTTRFVAAGRYFFTTAFAAGLNISFGDYLSSDLDAKTYGVDFRYNFK